MDFTKKMVLSAVIGLLVINVVQASPAKKSDETEQNARYFRSKVMEEFERKCGPIKYANFNGYDACLGNHDKLIELPFLKTLLKNSKNETFLSQDPFVKKCKTHMKDEIPNTGVAGYCKEVYPHFVMAHTEYLRSPNNFAYHLD